MQMISAVSILWGHFRVQDSAHGRARGLLAPATAVGILAAPRETLRTVELVMAAYLAVTGPLTVRRGLGRDPEGGPRTDLGRGGVGHLNLIWTPREKLSTCIELMWGRRENADGADGSATRIQTMVKYGF